MIISSSKVQNLLKIYNKNTSPTNKTSDVKGPASTGDQLALSSESKIKQRALQTVRQSPDIRQDKVDELRERLGAGTYEVTDDQVAEKMISSSLLDELI